MIKVAINGFGRIGRTTLRVWLARSDLQQKLSFVAINTSGSMDVAGWANLLKYDTAYGPLKQKVTVETIKSPQDITDTDPLIGYFIVDTQPASPAGGYKIPILAQRDPGLLPWGKYQVDVVIESTGVFRTESAVKPHLTAGAKKVLISAPAKGDTINTYVIGVNQYQDDQPIADNASCTTNCVAPVVAILDAQFGILKAAMNTIHAYTDDQRLQDGSHSDLRRARAAAQNIIPTTTGAATSTTKIIPQLKGLFVGLALRVPVITGSIADITCLVKTKTTVEAVNRAFKDAVQTPQWQGILAVNNEPLVSSDIIGRPESAIVDLPFTQVIDGDLVKVLAWYDNEWGYCNRLLEQAVVVSSQ